MRRVAAGEEDREEAMTPARDVRGGAQMSLERISDAELTVLCDSNGCPSVGDRLAQGQSQEQATAYLVRQPALYDDSEGRWLHDYINRVLHKQAIPFSVEPEER